MASCSGPRPTAPSSPTRAATTTPSPSAPVVTSELAAARLFSGSFGVAVRTDCRSDQVTSVCRDRLFATSDAGRSWAEITPPSRAAPGPLYDVSFLTPARGWATWADCARDRAGLVLTSDGGKSWQSFPLPTSVSCAAGAELRVGFTDPRHGWLLHLEPTASGAWLAWTADGGRRWSRSRRLPELAEVRFLDPGHGWLAGGEWGPLALYATTDGGATWTRRSVAPPSGYEHARRVYDLPTFFGPNRGVLPVTLFRRGRADLAFYLTADGGRTWRVASLLALGAVPPIHLPFPAPLPVAVAGPGLWWVVAGDPPTAYVTTDGGRRWARIETGLPSFRRAHLAATSARVAWVELWDGTHAKLAVTLDGGRSWRETTP